MSHHLVETIDLCFSYPDSPPALNGVSLRITHGESVAVVGGNGAGKSTLLLHLNGLLPPSSGQVRVGDIPVTPKTVARVRESVGMVFQQAEDQLFMPTVREDVAFGPLNMGLPPEEIRRRVDNALRQVDMYEFRQHAPHLLSGGQKQRTLLARAICASDKLLLLDEPVTGLDPDAAHEMYSAIRKINRELGCAVMMVTHDIGCAVREADKMLSMCRGHYFFGDVAEYLRHEKHDEEVHEHAEEEYHHHSKEE